MFGIFHRLGIKLGQRKLKRARRQVQVHHIIEQHFFNNHKLFDDNNLGKKLKHDTHNLIALPTVSGAVEFNSRRTIHQGPHTGTTYDTKIEEDLDEFFNKLQNGVKKGKWNKN